MLMTLLVPAFAAETTTSSDTYSYTYTPTTKTSGTTTSGTSSDGTDNGDTETRPVDEILTSYSNSNGRVLSMAHMGNARLYPEDSLSGFKSCVKSGIDILSCSVQETKDGQLVLMEDDTIDRMLTDTEGRAVTGKVSSYTLKQLQSEYYLRESHGGRDNDATKETVLSLSDLLDEYKDDVMIYITNGWSYAKLVNSTAKKADATDVVIIGGASSETSITNFTAKTGTPICHICATYEDGVNKDSAKKFSKRVLKAGADAVMLSTSDHYSSIFKNSTLKQFKDKGRAFISATDYSLAGERNDNMEGWNDLIKTGYSVIETDYPSEISTYLKQIESYRSTLGSLITQAQTLNSSSYSKDSYKLLENAIEEGENVSSSGSVTLTEIDNARYNLQEAIDALEYGNEVPKKSMNPWLIVLIVVLSVAVVFAAVILILRYINRHKNERRMHNEVANKFKTISEKNLRTAKTEVDDSVTPISTDGSSHNIIENLGGEEALKEAQRAEKERRKKWKADQKKREAELKRQEEEKRKVEQRQKEDLKILAEQKKREAEEKKAERKEKADALKEKFKRTPKDTPENQSEETKEPKETNDTETAEDAEPKIVVPKVPKESSDKSDGSSEDSGK